MTDKINILSYFETLCGDPGAANVLINSTLMSLFVRMLKSVRHERLRVRLCAVIGKLLRHATYIADELASTGLMDALAEALKDPSERVRRRAMGALGELLFFCATQQHDEGAREGGEGEGEGKAGSCWEVPGTVFSQVRGARGVRAG